MTAIFSAQRRHIHFVMLLLIVTGLLSGCFKKPRQEQEAIRDINAQCDVETLFQRALLPDRPLTLSDVIDIACVLNLEVYVKELEWKIQSEVATSDMLSMLPAFNAADYRSYRSNSPAAAQAVTTTDTLVPLTVSSRQNTHRWDHTLTWNILDFGVSYFRANAQTNRAEESRFEYERTKQNLILEIYKVYWKAIAAKRSLERSKEVLALSQDVQGKIQRETSERLIASTRGLSIQSQMLQIQQSLYVFEETYLEARAELAGLMGIPATLCFELAPVELFATPQVSSICEMEELALRCRPELYRSDAELDVSANDARVEFLQMFPSLALFIGQNADNNPFLVHNNWLLVGTQAAWNLLSIPQHYARAAAAKTRYYQSYDARLSLTIGVLSQVNLAYWRYQELFKQYNLQRNIYNVKRGLADATKKQFDAQEVGIVDVVQTEGDAIFSEVLLLDLYRDLQVALESVNNAIGWPLLFNTLEIDVDAYHTNGADDPCQYSDTTVRCQNE